MHVHLPREIDGIIHKLRKSCKLQIFCILVFYYRFRWCLTNLRLDCGCLWRPAPRSEWLHVPLRTIRPSASTRIRSIIAMASAGRMMGEGVRGSARYGKREGTRAELRSL